MLVAPWDTLVSLDPCFVLYHWNPRCYCSNAWIQGGCCYTASCDQDTRHSRFMYKSVVDDVRSRGAHNIWFWARLKKGVTHCVHIVLLFILFTSGSDGHMLIYSYGTLSRVATI